MTAATKKHLIDAVGHMAWAYVVLVPILLCPGVVGGIIAGFLLAAPREFWDQRPPSGFTLRFGWSRAWDLAGFMAGGAVAGWALGG